MSLSQDLGICSKPKFEDVHTFESNSSHMSHHDQISLQEYEIQQHASQISIPNEMYEAKYSQEGAQAMYYDHSGMNSYLHTAPPPNTLHLRQDGAYYGSQGLQMVPAFVHSPALYQTWQSDWQAMPASAPYVLAAGPPTDRHLGHTLISQEQVYPAGCNEKEALLSGQSDIAVENNFIHGEIKGKSEEFSPSPSTETSKAVQLTVEASPVSLPLPQPNLPTDRPHQEHHDSHHQLAEASQECLTEAAYNNGSTVANSHSDVKHVSEPVSSHHHEPVQYTSPIRTEIHGRNVLFVLASDPITEEVGWFLEGQSYRYQTSPCLDGNVPFPIRPLGSGILAGIHNDWLGEFPEPPAESNGGAPSSQGKPYKRFPTAPDTFESQHVRSLWQELERRRILEMNDPHYLHRLRHEAMMMLKNEAMQRRGRNGTMAKVAEPTEEEIDARSQMLWDQSKKSAVYAVGLLRQAEYCIAQGHLGFVPLQHPLQPLPTVTAPKKSRKRNQTEGTQRGESTVPEGPSKRKSRSNESLGDHTLAR